MESRLVVTKLQKRWKYINKSTISTGFAFLNMLVVSIKTE